MNTLQLNQILRQDRFTRSNFLGVFPSDQLPTNIPIYPACFIANVDSSIEVGSHWVGFFILDPERLEFFDSFGNAPSYFEGPISNFQSRFYFVDYNPIVLQSNVTAVCGQYCVYYLTFRCRGRTLEEIISSFVNKNICNDRRVYNFVWKRFQKRANFYQ